MKLRFSAIAAAVVALTLSGGARADTIVNWFGPGDTYQQGSGESIFGVDAIVNGSRNTLGRRDAVGIFTPSSDFDVTQIDVAVTWISGVNNFIVNLDRGFGGPSLGQWSLSNLPSFGSTNNTVQTLGGLSGITVLSGVQYVIDIAPGGSTSRGVFNNAHDFVNPAAFDVLGTPITPAAAVPEPALWAMILLGFGGLGAMLRARRNRPALTA
jgi:hypothetical protein